MHDPKKNLWVLLLAVAIGLTASPIATADEGRVADVVLAREALDTLGAARVRLDIDAGAKRDLLAHERGRVRDFPLPHNRRVDLELEAFDVVAPGARFTRVDEQGEHETTIPRLHAFRGAVAGDPDSVVALVLDDDGAMQGFVRTWSTEYHIGRDPQAPVDDASARAVWVTERQVDLSAPAAYGCEGALTGAPLTDGATHFLRSQGDPEAQGGGLGTTTRPGRTHGRERGSRTTQGGGGGSTTVTSTTTLRAVVAIDATVEFHDHFGTVQVAQAYIMNLMVQVAAIYDSELDVQLLMGDFRVFAADPDPYTDGSQDTAELLADLKSEWQSNRSGIDRTVAHLFSVRSSGGSGIAYVDVLCDRGFGYGVNTFSANGASWEKDLVAHEIGHNFSSPHTHCYFPEIDQCVNQNGCYQGQTVQSVGTIMSYCSQIQSVFHPRVRTEKLRPAAEAAVPSCMEAVGTSSSGVERVNTGDGTPRTIPR